LIAQFQWSLPDFLAGLLVQHEQGGVWPSRGADEAVAVDERRLGILPAANRSLVLLAEVLVPLHLARLRVYTGQIACGTDPVDEATIDGWRAASAGIAGVAG